MLNAVEVSCFSIYEPVPVIYAHSQPKVDKETRAELGLCRKHGRQSLASLWNQELEENSTHNRTL